MIAIILLIVGGLNWGLVGLFDFNLVMKIFGGLPWLEQLVYILVGVSAVLEGVTHAKSCKHCETNTTVQPAM